MIDSVDEKTYLGQPADLFDRSTLVLIASDRTRDLAFWNWAEDEAEAFGPVMHLLADTPRKPECLFAHGLNCANPECYVPRPERVLLAFEQCESAQAMALVEGFVEAVHRCQQLAGVTPSAYALVDVLVDEQSFGTDGEEIPDEVFDFVGEACLPVQLWGGFHRTDLDEWEPWS
jgi:hypothetical protein